MRNATDAEVGLGVVRGSTSWSRWTRRIEIGVRLGLAAVVCTSVVGCANLELPFGLSRDEQNGSRPVAGTVNVEQAQRFREAETERAANLLQEIARLKADLKTAESALVEAESGLAGSHTRADAVSSLATTRIQIERAATCAPWRSDEIEDARTKLEEAERQVSEGRFGAALFFVYRARRVAESVLDEADIVAKNGSARMIRGSQVNLRAGPSTNDMILSVLARGTPIFPQVNEGEWVLVQVSGGPAGWIHRRLVGDLVSIELGGPAAPRP